MRALGVGRHITMNIPIPKALRAGVLLVLVGALNASAATFTVTNTNDSGPGSLRQAIIAANANGQSNTINFDGSFSTAAQTITLASTLTVDSTAGGSLTINGPGANLLTISGNDAVQLFFLWDSASVSGVTLTRGRNNNGGAAFDNRATLNVANAVFTSNFGNNGGGAIVTQGALTVSNCIFDANGANGGGGAISVTSTGSATVSDSTFRNHTVPLGGAIASDGTINVTNCVFTNNAVTSSSATGLGGGAIYHYGKTANITTSTFTNNRETGNSGGGGAIRNRDGTMTISYSTFTENSSVDGGGAIASGGKLTINNSKIANNTTTGPNAQQSGQGGGGGISTNGAELTINNSVITGNSAANDGGGIYITASTVNIRNTTVSDNIANTNSDVYGSGGGVWIRAEGKVTVSGSTISGNLTKRNVTSNDTRFAGHGGGFWVQGVLTSENNTISGNTAEQIGGGVHVAYPGGGAGVLNLNSSTIVNNTAGSVGGVYWFDTLGHPPVNIRNTIIANNGSDISGTFASQGYNLIENPSGGTITGTTTGNITGVDPNLGALAENGGFTATHALLPGSPAIDKGHGGDLTVDQRGVTRPTDDPAIANACGGNGSDIGAFEIGAANGVAEKTLGNIATRLPVLTGENVLIGGIIVVGEVPKRVIIRALGPSLGAAGVSGALEDPTLELFQGDTLLAANDNWKDGQEAEIRETAVQPSDDREAAIVRTLEPGSYTAVVSGKGGTTGVALVEGYDLDQRPNSKLGNISTRGFVGSGENVLIGGFIVGPTTKVVVRAIGPSLGSAGVGGALQDPSLDLVNANGEVIRTNDDWKGTQRAELEAIGIQPSDDRESALIASLTAGNYTAVVRGAAGGTGVGLVEVYNLQ